MNRAWCVMKESGKVIGGYMTRLARMLLERMLEKLILNRYLAGRKLEKSTVTGE